MTPTTITRNKLTGACLGFAILACVSCGNGALQANGYSTGSNGTGASSGSGTANTSAGSVGGTCSSAATRCGGVCVDEQTDPNNCGACGQSCSGTCLSGRCLVTLASGQYGYPWGIAVDATNVYWTNLGVSPAGYPGWMGSVATCAKDGCQNSPANLAPGLHTPFAIAADGTSIYITNGPDGPGAPSTGVVKCPTSGCGSNPVWIASNQGGPSAVAVAGMSVYWVDGYGTAPGGLVMACPSSGCVGSPTLLASSPEDLMGLGPGIAADEKNVYWITPGINPSQPTGGTVMMCPGGGCGAGPTTIASGQDRPQGIAVDGESVYWINQGTGPDYVDGAVMKCAIVGCGGQPTALATGQAGPTALAVDGSSVYWINQGTQPNYLDGALMKCAASGCVGGPTVLVEGQSGGGVAVDATSVYWTDAFDSTVKKLTPK